MTTFRPETWTWMNRALFLIILALVGSSYVTKGGPWEAWVNGASGIAVVLALVWLLILLRRGFLTLALNLGIWVDRVFLVLLLASALVGIEFASELHPTITAIWGIAKWVMTVLVIWRLVGALRTQGIEAEKHRRLASEAREQALRSRLAPHFLFNTLNTLHAQIEADPRAAQATTERLAWIFRKVLECADRPTIPLMEEWSLVEAYLGLEQTRLGERLKVRVNIPEELESAKIPPLSLQVIVENAIKHGVAPLEHGGEVSVRAEMEDLETLRITVEDPGRGLSRHKGTGTALETLRQRLAKDKDLEMGIVNGRHRVSFLWKLA